VKTGLVLEGGSRQTIFTAGILDAMMDEHIEFPYIAGVSAGAHAAANFITRQRGRFRHIIMPTKLQQGKKKAHLFLDGIQKECHALHFESATGDMPFDFEKFFKSDVECEVAVTCCETGRVEFRTEKHDKDRLQTLISASCALPMIFPNVQIGERHYVDGCVSDPIPFEHAFEKGCEKIVAISTHFPGEIVTDFTKYKAILVPLFKYKFPNLFRALMVRYRRYEKMFARMQQAEKEGRLFLMRPERDLCDLFETDLKKLDASYYLGLDYAKARMAELKKFLAE
jgi:predicted patatin/cPLA2 family phospholipase